MLYIPKYCCQCGDKIERIEWKISSSRRFCELCETEFKIYDRLPAIIASFGIFFSILGLGTYLQKSDKPIDKLPKQLIATSLNNNKSGNNQNNSAQAPTNKIVQTTEQPPANVSTVETTPRTVSPVENSIKKQLPAAANTAPELVYFCGAATKKGLACTRKVKGGGRCWQHTGQPAIMPQDKLLVSR